jgi:non-canonical purine NTP pyrophosphatase (RdgB/HAM1 family)
MTKEIFYATSNDAKFHEVHDYISRYNIPIILKQYAQELEEPQTYDQRAIAVAKAKQAWERLQRPVLVDDSGVYFEKYHQFPGVFSKFVYYGIGLEGIFKLVNSGDRAYFLIDLVYAYGPGQYEVFEVKNNGSIVHPGPNFDATSRLPYLSIIIPDGSTKTYAQLKKEGKDHEFNFRIQAFKKFLMWMQNHEADFLVCIYFLFIHSY